MSNQFDNLTVEAVEMRERNDGTGEFPVAVWAGISLSHNASGNASFTKRRVSMPLNGMELEEAKELFPVGMKSSDFKIVAYHVDEPYEWVTPEGEVRTDTVRYTIVDRNQPIPDAIKRRMGGPAGQPASTDEPQSTREPAKSTEAPKAEVGTDAQ